jgi:hypothetical protein
MVIENGEWVTDSGFCASSFFDFRRPLDRFVAFFVAFFMSLSFTKFIGLAALPNGAWSNRSAKPSGEMFRRKCRIVNARETAQNWKEGKQIEIVTDH